MSARRAALWSVAPVALLAGALGACGGGGVVPAAGGSGGHGGAASGSGGAAGTGSGGTAPGGTGGASGSGGASGTGGENLPGDAGPDGGAASDADAAAPGACAGLFCEDFESGQIDPAKWSTPTANGATFMLQQKVVAHGKYAVQFHGNAGLAQADYAYLIWKNAPAAMAKHNFGRAYFYVTPKPHSIDMGMVFGGTAGFPKPTYLSIANHATGWQLGFIKLSGGQGEVQAYLKPDIPVGVWSCLEWEFNDQPTSINVWIDGQPIGSLNNQTINYPAHMPGKP
ncbi:MAG TPA: hypothetical protein VMU50_20440, partial [Polyangia bacterium]|nr:hypothetical protein [Polyangia bacterium]